MATNHTEYYNLSQWVRTDPVVMDDFNEDNRKIDAALHKLLKFRTGSYVGTGKSGAGSPNRIEFDGKPMLVLIGSKNYCAWIVRGTAFATSTYGTNLGSLSLTWEDNALSWYSPQDVDRQLNAQGQTYQYLVLLSET